MSTFCFAAASWASSCAIACFVFWLVFLKFKWLRMTPGWVFGFSIVVLHLMLIFVIGLRFVTPQSASAKVVQHATLAA